MIEKEKHIKELYNLKHRHDSDTDRFDYENELFIKTFSRQVFKNNLTNDFLQKIQKLTVWMFESVLIVRNFWNYTVDKYYNKHKN